MAKFISLDGDIAVHHANTLQQSAADLASPDVVDTVNGDRDDPAASLLTTRFETVSGRLSTSVENLRLFVADKADALNQAVQALQQTDRMTADAAGQATALIDELAAAPSTSTSSTAGAPSDSGHSEARSDFSGM